MSKIKSHIGEVLSPTAGGRVAVRLHVGDADDCCGCAIAEICGAQGRGAVVEASLPPAMQATAMTGRKVRLRSTFGSTWWSGTRLFVLPCLLLIIVPVVALQFGADESAAALAAFIVVAVVAVAAVVIRRRLRRKPAWIVEEIL